MPMIVPGQVLEEWPGVQATRDGGSVVHGWLSYMWLERENEGSGNTLVSVNAK